MGAKAVALNEREVQANPSTANLRQDLEVAYFDLGVPTVNKQCVGTKKSSELWKTLQQQNALETDYAGKPAEMARETAACQ